MQRGPSELPLMDHTGKFLGLPSEPLTGGIWLSERQPVDVACPSSEVCEKAYGQTCTARATPACQHGLAVTWGRTTQ